MKYLLTSTALLFSSCALFQQPPPPEDPSIRFPKFHESFATRVGQQQGQPYELDGVTLRAISIAANDFIPPGRRDRQCWERQEAQRYQVIRQGDIIFVEIGVDPRACHPDTIPLDGGAKYAIRTDGRILRRLFDGEPEDLHQQESGGTSYPASQVGGVWGPSATHLPAAWSDAGTRPTPEAGPPMEDGGAAAPDGGSPGGSTTSPDGG